MDDAEYLFHKTSKDAKRIARGSFNKKGGSKSKGCRLPSDFMTEKERKAMNSPVVSYNLSKPMNGKQFKELPIDLAKKYLDKLATEHEARGMDVADMLGYSRGGFYNMLHSLYRGEKTPFTVNKRIVQSDKWLEFIGPKVEAVPVEAPIPEEPKPVEPVKETPEEKPLLIPRCDFENISLNAVGDPLVIFAQIAKLIEVGKTYRVYINIWQNENPK